MHQRLFQLVLISLSIFLFGTLISLRVYARTPAPFLQVLSSSTPNSSSNSLPYTISYSAETADARPLIVKKYLSKHTSPLEPFSDRIVAIADLYHVDPKLLVAIARQESNLCKIIPPGSHNCWGFGIYDDNVVHFDDYSQAIEAVAKTLKSDYIDRGLDTPEKIMTKYTPPSVAIGGPWAKAIRLFLSDLE